jgi:hypothetical protein
MKRRDLMIVSAALLGGLPVGAQEGFTLVTESLAAAEEDFNRRAQPVAPPPRRTRSMLPAINVITPQADAGELLSPLRIELRFETSADARILLPTFRVLYGLLKFDLTDTVRQNATMNEQGLLAEHAAVPRGSHRLFLQIGDDKRRTAEYELKIRVRG